MISKIWQLQDAKARFSEFLREALIAPQTVSVRGENKTVMVSLNYFKEITTTKPSLKDLLATLPFKI
jgi:prevent-host-death family protein